MYFTQTTNPLVWLPKPCTAKDNILSIPIHTMLYRPSIIPCTKREGIGTFHVSRTPREIDSKKSKPNQNQNRMWLMAHRKQKTVCSLASALLPPIRPVNVKDAIKTCPWRVVVMCLVTFV